MDEDSSLPEHGKASMAYHSNRLSDSRSPNSSMYSSISSPVPSLLPGISSAVSTQSTLPDSSRCWTDGDSTYKNDLLDVRSNLICNWLHQKQTQRMWTTGEMGEGVMLKKTKNEYVCCPSGLPSIDGGFFDMSTQLNVKCAMTVNTRTTRLLLRLNMASNLPLAGGLRLQVLADLSLLPKCQKHQFAAFIQSPPILVVWDDDPAHLVDRVQELEDQMMELALKGRFDPEKESLRNITAPESMQQVGTTEELESGMPAKRKAVLIQPLIIAVTLAIMSVALGSGWRSITVEVKIQRTWSCLLLPILGPIQAWLGLFFFQTLPNCIAQVVGPVRQLKENSKYYSGKISPRLPGPNLPHVTVQCPIYKESLNLVIGPTIRSIKDAISIYEMQGGTANIFVNDDGLQLITKDEARRRLDFFEEHNIGWVARPKHNPHPRNGECPFIRAGKFKKASNLNHSLNVSMRVEEALQAIQRSNNWTAEDERVAYDTSLARVIAEENGASWAAGDIRIGDYILLIDSDTRVPKDCLLDAVSELEQSPAVAILQFSSGVINVTDSWFEQGITFFTNLIYTAIEFAVANGDVAPFVGHNAFLRWSAIQDIACHGSEQAGYQHFWSENTVSEDFDMALRLQTSGYTLRLATYANRGFKEGVSLTVYDELARWEKYAYGCSELVFNPLAQWPFRGPINALFCRFVFSSMPLHSKISIVAYVGTYFAIASSWVLTVLNYFLIGWYNGYLDHYYIDSFQIYFSTIVVFNCVGNIALAVLRYRTEENKLLPSLVENFKWVVFLTTFLGGISLHVSQAILCHLFSVNTTWGATSKEVSTTSFFREIPIILRRFRFTFTFCFVMAVLMVVLAGLGPFQGLVPYDWQITKFTAVFPLSMMLASHALLPLALNPGLMQFTF